MREFDNSVRAHDDECFLVTRELQNRSVENYNLENFYLTSQCQTSKDTFYEYTAKNPNLRYKVGYGFTDGCVVDSDSTLRNGSSLTHDKGKHQLCTRWAQAVPSFNRGGLVANIDSRLKMAEDTSAIRDCQKTTEKDFNRFVPLNSCLAKNIQNPKHIVPTWRWGGESTRTYVMDNQWLEQCGFSQNGQMWVRQ